MMSILDRLTELINKYDSEFKDSDETKHLLIPPEIYDEICDRIKQTNITLFGVT